MFPVQPGETATAVYGGTTALRSASPRSAAIRPRNPSGNGFRSGRGVAARWMRGVRASTCKAIAARGEASSDGEKRASSTSSTTAIPLWRPNYPVLCGVSCVCDTQHDSFITSSPCHAHSLSSDRDRVTVLHGHRTWHLPAFDHHCFQGEARARPQRGEAPGGPDCPDFPSHRVQQRLQPAPAQPPAGGAELCPLPSG